MWTIRNQPATDTHLGTVGDGLVDVYACENGDMRLVDAFDSFALPAELLAEVGRLVAGPAGDGVGTCNICGNVLAADERGACDHHFREEIVHGYGRDAEY